jgi:predicted RNA binding protein YcfA (HicA-like mRNA interferase family)
LPRDVDGDALIKALRRFGYHQTRQAGSHVTMTWPDAIQHHLTVPMHRPIKAGTLSAILKEFRQRHSMDSTAVVRALSL